MSNDVALQANFKTPGGALLNVYGKTADEFEFNLKAFNALLDLVSATEVAVNGAKPSAVAQVQASLGATVINDPTVAAPPAPAPAVANAGAPACRHGGMVFKEGTSKAGKPYKMWSCTSTNRQEQCDPQWVR